MEPGTIVYLASDLGPTAAARQLALLAANLPRDRFAAEVLALGPAAGPTAESLQTADVPVRSVPVRHMLDFGGVRRLRKAVVATGPAVVHAWGPFAARVSGLLGARVVASAAADPSTGVTGWLTARQLHRAARVVAASWAEGERYRRLGVPADHLTRIGPAVGSPGPVPDAAAVRRELGIPPHARLVVAGDRLDPAAGLRDAVWAFDILRYDHPDLYLVLVGDGPERANLEAFGRALAFDDFRVRFVGPRPELFALADVVWVAHDRGGVEVALEAMAAGRPVVGAKTADLAELIEDGATGLLAARGDRPALAAKAKLLLDDAGLRQRIGEAGRARVRERFSVGRMVEQFARVYGELVG